MLLLRTVGLLSSSGWVKIQLTTLTHTSIPYVMCQCNSVVPTSCSTQQLQFSQSAAVATVAAKARCDSCRDFGRVSMPPQRASIVYHTWYCCSPRCQPITFSRHVSTVPPRFVRSFNRFDTQV